MKKLFNYKYIMIVAAVTSLLFVTGCNDEWDNHYKDKGVNSKLTLFDAIKADPMLSDFLAVSEACGIVDSLLNASRVYTLWAPVNGTFNKDSLLRLVDEGERNNVLNRFILGHITDYLHPATGVKEDNVVELLNEKKALFIGADGEYTFDGIPLIMDNDASNQRVRNGILHKIGGVVNYSMSLWEYLPTDARIDSLAQYLYSYNIRRFNEYASIQGPTVNGEITYIEKVYTTSNFWLEEPYGIARENSGFGDISNEDSLYTMFAFTNRVWDEMVPYTSNYFKFHVGHEDDRYKFDSLQYTWARKMLCNYLVFSDKEQRHLPADIAKEKMLANFRYGNNGFESKEASTVRYMFDKEQLMSGVIDSVEMSNGKLYIVDSFNYTPQTIFYDTIKVEGEVNSRYITYDNSNTYLQTNYVTSMMQNDSVTGKLSGNTYLLAGRTSTGKHAQIKYKIPNTLSGGKYRVGIVIVPPHITNSTLTSDQLKKTNISAVVETRDASGKVVKAYDTATGVTIPMLYGLKAGLQNDATRIDTVYLYDIALDRKNNYNVDLREPAILDFNYCEYGLSVDSVRTTITLKSNITQDKDYNTWESSLRIDCIILEPVLETAESTGK